MRAGCGRARQGAGAERIWEGLIRLRDRTGLGWDVCIKSTYIY